MNAESFARMFAAWMQVEYVWNSDAGIAVNYEMAAEQFETEFVNKTEWLKAEYTEYVGYHEKLVMEFYEL